MDHKVADCNFSWVSDHFLVSFGSSLGQNKLYDIRNEKYNNNTSQSKPFKISLLFGNIITQLVMQTVRKVISQCRETSNFRYDIKIHFDNVYIHQDQAV